MAQKFYIGMDVGGTAVKTGLCDPEGKLLLMLEMPTAAHEGKEAVMDRMAAAVHTLVEKSACRLEDVAGIGIGIAGFLDIPNGMVRFSGNLPGWRDVPLKSEMERRLGKPVVINNDANAAALAEAWAGAGAGLRHAVCLTLGTGVGGGLILDGKLHEGHHGMAGELGHIRVVAGEQAVLCGCGQYGCVETVSSATGIVRMAKEAVERGESTSLAAVDRLTAKDVFAHAQARDEVAQRVVRTAAHYLGLALAVIAMVVNPQRFIIGGGVSRAGEPFFNLIRDSFRKHTPEHAQEGVDIVPAAFGHEAGVIGAAGLLHRHFSGE